MENIWFKFVAILPYLFTVLIVSIAFYGVIYFLLTSISRKLLKYEISKKDFIRAFVISYFIQILVSSLILDFSFLIFEMKINTTL